MECKNCELKQRRFYCENCLRTHLRDFRHRTAHASAERDDQVTKASRALTSVEGARLRRADLVSSQERLQEVMGALTKLKKDNDKARERLRSLRETLATRRRNLAAAKLLPSTPLDNLISRQTQDLGALSDTIARARSGLIQELVEVFHVVEVGGRPPIGGKAGTKGEWTIGDLVLPVPGDIRSIPIFPHIFSICLCHDTGYPPDHINAVITHTIHFLGLLSFYLGIKLPFEITWSERKLGVGQPSIGAIRGGESGSWAKWFSKQPLHVSSSPAPPNSSPTLPSTPLLTSESFIDANTSSQSSFTTAFAMLLYNVCYIAHTQSVDVPLSQAGDVLSNLWAVCCSPDLGRRSHETHPLLAPPTPSSFPLDFAQLLQATTATPASRARIKARRASGSGTAPRSQKRHEKIPEEDDGWDLVEDAADGSFG
ncbi:hypothetical protein JAAARDRAFT_39033 [Jaapia argillacea MUCL 33604]|uniref:Autophagy-related protein 14 n=1 Tax=Jaapia argillacea MUCL 33604 TaxID=933084 RepID=A0A067PTQ3_9AGAM|nr:hypothetical protein JAAARDRAFT_39033 [Jaapia argillacea MUCL 33604]